MADLLPGEEVTEVQSPREVDRVRVVVSDTYTFVRSQEINRTIGSFTFDHYIDEAKRQIKGEGTALRRADGSAFGLRPTKLEALSRLETEFRATLETMRTMAEAADNASEDEREPIN